MGKILGGSSKTVVNVPPPTAAEQELTAISTEKAKFELEELKKGAGLQAEYNKKLDAFLADMQKTSEAQLAEQAKYQPLYDEILQGELERIRRGGAASPEEISLIQQATGAARETGKQAINAFSQDALEDIKNILAPSRGLRPTDSPILDRGGLVQREATRQFGQLSSGLAESEANARLNFPLARDQLLSSMSQFQLGLGESARNFQAQLRQQAADNQFQLAQLRQSGLASVTGTPFSAAGTLGALTGIRGVQTSTKTTNSPGLLDIISTIAGVGRGFGSAVAGYKGLGGK